MLEIENLWKSFGDVLALRSVDLRVEAGELFVLLGPSGCGKTTLIRIVAGLEKPDRGNVSFDGRCWGGLSPRERNVAMVFQNFGLYPHRTVQGNIEYPLRVAGCSRRQREARGLEMARLLGIEALLHRRPRELSGGEAQRVALGRALVRRPACFLLDEPLGSLDAQLRFRTRGEIKRIQREVGVTTVYVTHDQAEALAIGDRIGLMDKGEIVQVGRPRELLRSPRNTFVASFVGVPPAILVPGTLKEDSIRFGGGDDLPRFRRPPGLHAREGQDLLLGIQADRFEIVVGSAMSAEEDGLCTLLGTVTLVEGIEPDLIIHCSTSLGELRIRSHVNPGLTEVQLRFRPQDVIVFDSQTGESIQSV